MVTFGGGGTYYDSDPKFKGFSSCIRATAAPRIFSAVSRLFRSIMHLASFIERDVGICHVSLFLPKCTAHHSRDRWNHSSAFVKSWASWYRTPKLLAEKARRTSFLGDSVSLISIPCLQSWIAFSVSPRSCRTCDSWERMVASRWTLSSTEVRVVTASRLAAHVLWHSV